MKKIYFANDVLISYPKKPGFSKAQKAIIILYKLMHIIFGIDFGFFNYLQKTWRNLVRVGVLVYALSISYTYWSRRTYFNVSGISTISYIFQYVSLIIVLLLFKRGTTFYDLCFCFTKIDAKINVDLSRKTSLMLMLFIALMIVFRILYILAFREALVFGVEILMILGTDIVKLTYAMVFYSINIRLSKLLEIVAEAEYDFLRLQRIYKSIADTSDKFKKAFDLVMIWSLIFETPFIMGTIYHVVVLIKNKILIFKTFFLTISITLVQMFAPAVFAGLLPMTAEKIANELHKKLMVEFDDVKLRRIEKFINYINARPMKYTIFKIIPLDADLICLALNFCVTYLIVIIQFTVS